jgi:cytidylate kinase
VSVESVDFLGNYLRTVSHLATRPGETPRPAIAISRESGAGALTVATLVAEKLYVEFPGDPPCPWTVLDQNLVSKILEDHNLSKRIEEFMPENIRFPLSESFEFLLGLHPRSGLLREYATNTIRKLAMIGNVVLIGRGAAVVTADLPYVLRVRLVAPFDCRVQNFARSHGITEEKAMQIVRANDAARRRFVRAYLNTDVTDVLHYNLVINTGSDGFQGAAQIICAAVRDLVSNSNQ